MRRPFVTRWPERAPTVHGPVRRCWLDGNGNETSSSRVAGTPWMTPQRGAWGRDEDAMDVLLRRLLDQAYLFDDPAAYEAGVRDALELLWGDLLVESPSDGHQPTGGRSLSG